MDSAHLDQGIAYETAQYVLTQLLAETALRIEQERESDDPDQQLLTRWDQQRRQWQSKKSTLQLSDVREIASILDHEGSQLRTLYGKGH